MKQEINFFRGSSRIADPLLGAWWLVRACVVVILLLTVTSLGQLSFDRDHEKTLLALERQVNQMERQVKTLQAQLPDSRGDPRLLAEADRLQNTANTLERVLNIAEQTAESQRGGFSGYFEALARQTVPGVWLTGIRFMSAGSEFELEGRALDSADIPRLVRLLGAENRFRSRTFSALKISRPKDHPGFLEFVLRTQAPKDDKSG